MIHDFFESHLSKFVNPFQNENIFIILGKCSKETSLLYFWYDQWPSSQVCIITWTITRLFQSSYITYYLFPHLSCNPALCALNFFPLPMYDYMAYTLSLMMVDSRLKEKNSHLNIFLKQWKYFHIETNLQIQKMLFHTILYVLAVGTYFFLFGNLWS